MTGQENEPSWKKYWVKWYSKPENREQKRVYAKKRYEEKKHDKDDFVGILTKKKIRLDNQTPEQREDRLRKMREYNKIIYAKKKNRVSDADEAVSKDD